MLREHKNTIRFAKNNVAHFCYYFILKSLFIYVFNLLKTKVTPLYLHIISLLIDFNLKSHNQNKFLVHVVYHCINS